jgi:hypothetical protein
MLWYARGLRLTTQRVMEAVCCAMQEDPHRPPRMCCTVLCVLCYAGGPYRPPSCDGCAVLCYAGGSSPTTQHVPCFACCAMQENLQRPPNMCRALRAVLRRGILTDHPACAMLCVLCYVGGSSPTTQHVMGAQGGWETWKIQ